MMRERTPWGAWLQASFAFGLPPDLFWRLSLKEWRALTAPASAHFDRAALDALAARFPDYSHDQS